MTANDLVKILEDWCKEHPKSFRNFLNQATQISGIKSDKDPMYIFHLIQIMKIANLIIQIHEYTNKSVIEVLQDLFVMPVHLEEYQEECVGIWLSIFQK